MAVAFRSLVTARAPGGSLLGPTSPGTRVAGDRLILTIYGGDSLGTGDFPGYTRRWVSNGSGSSPVFAVYDRVATNNSSDDAAVTGITSQSRAIWALDFPFPETLTWDTVGVYKSVSSLTDSFSVPGLTPSSTAIDLILVHRHGTPGKSSLGVTTPSGYTLLSSAQDAIASFRFGVWAFARLVPAGATGATTVNFTDVGDAGNVESFGLRVLGTA